MKRGEVWIGNLNPNRGREPGKIRPVLVLQANHLIGSGSETVIILPFTHQARKGIENLRLRVPARDQLIMDSYLMMDKPRSLDRSRFGEGPLTSLTPVEMAKVEKTFLAVVGMI